MLLRIFLSKHPLTNVNLELIMILFCRLYESVSEKENKQIGLQTQVQVKADMLTLQNKIVSLKQDRTLRNELEPVFREFIKTSHLHPGSVVQQCLLSLL